MVNYKIPMDDPVVREILDDLAREVTQRDLDAIERSIRLRGLGAAWNAVTDRASWFPVIGESWDYWLHGVALRSVSVRQALALLADAGVLGTQWADEDAKNRVFEERGWR